MAKLLSAILGAGLVVAGSADVALKWSAELKNLRFDALAAAEVQRLSSDYAAEVASALGLRPEDVSDAEGRPGLVTLAASAPGPAPSGATTTTTTIGATTSTTTEAPATTTSTTTWLPDATLQPIQGIGYGAMPCTDSTCGGHGLPSADDMQMGYSEQWGAQGRNDLEVMTALGANSVRLYHSLGRGSDRDHSAFLNHAQALRLNVMPGYHSELASEGHCPNFDCFEAWKDATLKGFQLGFRHDQGWHAAVSTLIILNEPDFLENNPQCNPSGAWCRVKAVLSALDGVLAAEREANVSAGRVRLTATWSFAQRTSIDGKLTGPGTFGFQDMVAGIADPLIANYTPRSEMSALQEAFSTRWIHGLNTQAPWAFVKEMVSNSYKEFLPMPWFIGEYGANGQTKEVIQQDLEAMALEAQSDDSHFAGVAFFQFQTAFEKGGSELNFGLFALGDEVIGQTGDVCDDSSPCSTWPVHCLSTELSWLPGSMGQRAEAVAAAWKGSVRGAGLCGARATTATGEEATTSIGATTTIVSTTKFTGITTSPAPTTTRTLAQGEIPLRPIRGIAYGALPCTEHDCGGGGLPSQDMLQAGYAMQWGPLGRDDLGSMASLGGNAVRLYHSLGLEAKTDHGAFLDHAKEVGLNVFPGYHTENANDPTECPGYDCFDTWKKATLKGFEQGLRNGSEWHPAVAMLILLNEPDFFEFAPKCQPSGAWCRVKAALSALDGVLAAEQEAGVAAGRTRLTVTWSFAVKTSIDGTVEGPGIFGFQDMVAGIANPELAKYTPRMPQVALQRAFNERWVHGVNTASPWDFVNEMISEGYDARFGSTRWFIGEYGAMGQDLAVIQADLEAMDQSARQGGHFLGSAFFQFQTSYWKGGQEMNFGLFSLEMSSTLGETGELCDKMTPNCHRWPVHCLSTELSWLPGTKADRAAAVAAAWGGAIPSLKCAAGRRLGEEDPSSSGARIELRLRSGLVEQSQVEAKLGSGDFATRLIEVTIRDLGANSSAIQGRLGLADENAETVAAETPQPQGGIFSRDFPQWGWILLAALAGLSVLGCLASAVVLCGSKARDAARRQKENDMSSADSETSSV